MSIGVVVVGVILVVEEAVVVSGGDTSQKSNWKIEKMRRVTEPTDRTKPAV